MAKGQSSGVGQSMTGAQMKSRFRNPMASSGGQGGMKPQFDRNSFLSSLRGTTPTGPPSGGNTPTNGSSMDFAPIRPMGIMQSGGGNTPTFSGPLPAIQKGNTPSPYAGGSSMDLPPITAPSGIDFSGPMGISKSGGSNTPINGSSMDLPPIGTNGSMLPWSSTSTTGNPGINPMGMNPDDLMKIKGLSPTGGGYLGGAMFS